MLKIKEFFLKTMDSMLKIKNLAFNKKIMIKEEQRIIFKKSRITFEKPIV